MAELNTASPNATAALTPRVRILSIDPVVSTPKRDGSRIIAHFDADIPHVQLRRWSIIQTVQGDLRIAAPVMLSGRRHSDRLTNPVRGRIPGIKLTDATLHRELFHAAVRAWQGISVEARKVPLADSQYPTRTSKQEK